MNFTIVAAALVLLSSFLSFHCDENTDEEATITIESPNGGENWQIGTTHFIKWSSKNVSGDVKIEVSFDGGSSYSTLWNGTVNDNEEAWTLTGTASTTALIKISSLTDPAVSGESNDKFTVSEVIHAPSNLQAAVSAAHDITLTWQDHSSDEDGFIIERKIGSVSAWVERARVGVDTVTYKDSLLATNLLYSYRVRAYSSLGISGETSTASKILGWVIQQSGTTQSLNGIAYTSQITALTAIAVGENGTILRTTNGGNEWKAISSGTANALYAVAFGNASIGVAVGAKGTILRTGDAGVTWTKQTVGGENYNFKGVDYATVNDVYAVGSWRGTESDTLYGTIYRSTDGGINWGALFDQRLYNFEDVLFNQQDVGYVVGRITSANHEAIFKTTNRGTIWNKLSDESSLPLLSINFVDAVNGRAVGEAGTILHTINGGTSWTDEPYFTLKTLRAVAFADNSRGVIAGDAGFVLRTTDGGASWFQQSTGSTEQFNAIYLKDANTQTIVGTNGAIVKTDNGGAQ